MNKSALIWLIENFYSPKCLDRQNRIVRIVCAIICIFSKFTSPSKLVLLPSCAKVISFNSSGINGITGGCNFPTKLLKSAENQNTKPLQSEIETYANFNWIRTNHHTHSLSLTSTLTLTLSAYHCMYRTWPIKLDWNEVESLEFSKLLIKMCMNKK